MTAARFTRADRGSGEQPDRAAVSGEELRVADLRAERAGVDEDDFAIDRLERGAEMLASI